jgi:hypothetical protein
MEERKRFPKVQIPCRVKIGSAAEFLMVHTENVGPGGIRIFLAASIVKGTQIKIEMFLEPGYILKNTGFVVWAIKDPIAEKTTMDKYDIGIQFDSLTEDNKKKLYELVDKINSQGIINQVV